MATYTLSEIFSPCSSHFRLRDCTFCKCFSILSPSLIFTFINWRMIWNSVVCVLGLYFSSKVCHITAGSVIPSMYTMMDAEIDAPIVDRAFLDLRMKSSSFVSYSAIAAGSTADAAASVAAADVVGVVGAVGRFSFPWTISHKLRSSRIHCSCCAQLR